MSDNQTNLNEILYKQDARLRLAMTLIPQRDQKASLELRICTRAYAVNYICDPKAVFRDFFDQQKDLIRMVFRTPFAFIFSQTTSGNVFCM